MNNRYFSLFKIIHGDATLIINVKYLLFSLFYIIISVARLFIMNIIVVEETETVISLKKRQ